jgi:SAM-dependent methyltransferase
LFSNFANRIMTLVDLGPRCSFLDVGCGTGTVLVRAAARVENTAAVVGIDISPGMLLQVRHTLASEGPTAELVVADAGSLPCPDTMFDVVVSNFAFTSFPAPERAATEMRRVLKRGGGIALCISSGWWFQNDQRWRRHEDLLENLDVPLPMSQFQNREVVASTLEDAGIRLTSVETEVFPLRWADVDDWWEWNWSHGYRAVLETLSHPRLEKYRTECLKRLGTGPVNGQLEVHVVLGQ